MAERTRLASLGALLLLAVSLSHAAVVYTDISADSITVGDRIRLRVSMLLPPESPVVPPEVEDGLGPFVVKDWSVARSQNPKADSITYEYIVTAYETGLCTIPAQPYLLPTEEGVDTLRSEPMPVLVASVITTDSATLRDIKPPLIAGTPSLWWLWLLLSIAAVGTGIYLLYWFRRKAQSPASAPPPKPPYDEAIQALEALERKGLPSRGMVREHVFELSEILKRYASRRYMVNVTDYTTEEILEWAETAPFGEQPREAFRWFFETSHPVKFARLVPPPDTTDRFMIAVRGFVDATRPQPEPEKPYEQARGSA
jgi:hypothetical protein